MPRSKVLLLAASNVSDGSSTEVGTRLSWVRSSLNNGHAGPGVARLKSAKLGSRLGGIAIEFFIF